MSIAAAAVTIDVLVEQAEREMEAKYAFYQMLHATDRVLWRLEEFNRDGVKHIDEGVWLRMCLTLAGLPEPVLAALADSTRVQELLDSVFEAQEVLFRLHDPARPPADDLDDEAVPDGLEEQIEAHLRGAPEGLTPNELALLFRPSVQSVVRRLVVRMASQGRVRHEIERGTGGAPKRRYLAAGEGE